LFQLLNFDILPLSCFANVTRLHAQFFFQRLQLLSSCSSVKLHSKQISPQVPARCFFLSACAYFLQDTHTQFCVFMAYILWH
jgi:putative component of membrane protein insertase Oxa1/YidC/SpoIIIJ protein YidD